MLSQVDNFIKLQQLFNKGELLVVATSGGKDSMALLHYLQQEGYKLIVAHCNFKLRDIDSDVDQQFIEQYCIVHNLQFETINFDTNQIASEQRQSIQVAARTLRYDWLELIREKFQAACIVTAHHLNDNIETLLFNLTKGTGVKGLRGMLPKNGKIVRPFLETEVQEIWDYIQSNRIQFREDSSNASTKYDRNKIRHQVVPILEEINEHFTGTFKEHFKRWQDIAVYHQLIIEEWRKKLFIEKGEQVFIPIEKIKHLNFSKSLMFELLSPYKFNDASIEDMMQSFDAPEAKLFESSTHKIIKDRKFLILSPLDASELPSRYIIKENTKQVNFGEQQLLQLHLKPIRNLARISTKSKYAYIDADLLTFPLILRKWETGDYMYPFGLNKANGKPSKKKLSKILRDQKLSAHEKDNTWVLCSGTHVVWLLGHRLDERFKLSESTKTVLQLELK